MNSFPRITALLLSTLLSATTAKDPGTNCDPGKVNLFGGNPHDVALCLGDGSYASINLQSYHDDKINVVANPLSVTEDPIKCVKFSLTEDGAGSPYYTKKEKNAAYSMYGNSGLNFFGGKPIVGANQKLTVCSYSNKGCSNEILCIDVTLDVIDEEVPCEPIIDWIDFHDAEDDNGFFDCFGIYCSVPDGICIPPSGQLAIQATTRYGGCIDKVHMKLEQDGLIIKEKTDNNEPFSLYKNSGGDFYGAYLAAGHYTITAVPNDNPNYTVSYDFTLLDCSGEP